jgi:superfamily II DNA or RNA helicase
LDCGLGKRFITHQIVAERFPDLRFIIVANSTGSRDETVDYMYEYGDMDEDLGEVSSRTPYWLRKKEWEDKRVIITTATVFERQTTKYPRLILDFDAVIINEIDTIIRRRGDVRTLTQPWPKLLAFLSDMWFIGMSGTLRDSHSEYRSGVFHQRQDLQTLLDALPGEPRVVRMEEFEDTDIGEHISPTHLRVVLIEDRQIHSISVVLDELIRNASSEIRSLDPQHVHGPLYQVIQKLDVPEKTKAHYQRLLFLRKYLFAMPPWKILWFLGSPGVKQYFNLKALRDTMPRESKKVWRVVDIAKQSEKTVVLASYLKTVESIRKALEKNGIAAFKLTGEVEDKGAVLREFKAHEEKAALVMSTVGERDLDIGEADTLIVYDAIKTEKTMYQRIKRTRGGRVEVLTYAGTSEERGLRRLIDSIVERYPWSCSVE